MTISPGQVYRSCDPRGGSSIRITHYQPGDARAHVVDAITGKRPRQVLVKFLHATATTKTGKPRRTGYVWDGRITADDWNARYPIGTPVIAYPGCRPEPAGRKPCTDCPRLETRTRSIAWPLGHGELVVKVDGYAGGISLEHIDLIAQQEQETAR